MEQIYTIPINEAFEASAHDGTSCPFCIIRKKFEENEIELILGASAMEPDIRIKTNERGFCADHFSKMLKRGKKLPVALMLESHLDTVCGKLKGKSVLPGFKAKSASSALSVLSRSCYLCDRLDENFGRVMENAIYMWRSDSSFRNLFSRQRAFCVPHAASLLEFASKNLKSSEFGTLCSAVRAVQEDYLAREREKISRFIKKFDYRYEDEPWGDAKEAVEDAIRALRGDV